MTPITSHNNTFCASSTTSRDTICDQQMATRLSKANREYRRFKLRKRRWFQPFGLVRTVSGSEAQNFGQKTVNQSSLCIVLRRGSIHVPGHAWILLEFPRCLVSEFSVNVSKWEHHSCRYRYRAFVYAFQ